MRALILLATVASALSYAVANAEPVFKCEGGLVRAGQCICPSGRRLHGGHCEDNHNTSAAAASLRRQGNCLSEEAAALHGAEIDRSSALTPGHEAASGQISRGRAPLGVAGTQIATVPSAPSPPTCPPSDTH